MQMLMLSGSFNNYFTMKIHSEKNRIFYFYDIFIAGGEKNPIFHDRLDGNMRKGNTGLWVYSG